MQEEINTERWTVTGKSIRERDGIDSEEMKRAKQHRENGNEKQRSDEKENEEEEEEEREIRKYMEAIEAEGTRKSDEDEKKVWLMVAESGMHGAAGATTMQYRIVQGLLSVIFQQEFALG